MDGQELHLALNHFPIILAVVGTAAALLAFLTRKRNALLYALATLTLAGLSSYPALLTGDQADRVLRSHWYIERATIEAHAESADVSNVLLILTGLVCAVCWYRVLREPREASPAVWMLSVVVVLGLASSASVGWTAWQGGFILSKSARLNGATPGSIVPSAPPERARTTPPGTQE